MNLTAAWVMLALAILCLVVASLFIWFFIIFKRRVRANKEEFELVTGKFRYFQFWQFYAFIVVIFAGYVAAIVLFGISIPELV